MKFVVLFDNKVKIGVFVWSTGWRNGSLVFGDQEV
jgi:hypothetical protein